jgi:putative acetyltransferase
MSAAVAGARIVSSDPGRAEALLAALDGHLDQLYPECAGLGLTLDDLRQANVYFAIAQDAGGAPIGCGAFCRHHGYAEMKRVWIQPAHRRSGLARKLFAHLEAQLRLEGVRVARLETGNRQPGAVACFTRLGYSACPPFGDYPANGISLFFEKPL